ncbi:Zona pellucida sperm-binding protein 3 [Merluccius polli]|uniref:Zona pellucida sperm-binding protein 3 n=1 Tax=Merluccius polli TaxID=89951 RepID=A0AA47PA04_MERPO|nr:Zona pellucida sperm-binding protein 3 [Merluccius polli]
MRLLLGVLLVWFGTGTLLPARSALAGQVAALSRRLFDGFPFPSELDFQDPYDTLFSSWQTSRPDFHMLTELPPFMSVPHIQVLCNRSRLTLLVDKAYSGVPLNGDDLRLGDGCHVNGDLENQFVLTYDLNQCGTSRVVQRGLEIFSNFLHVNSRRSVFNWWPSPFTLPLSCTPNMQVYKPPSVPFPVEFPREEWNFVIQPMNSFWTHTAHSPIYERGQKMHFQVTAKADPGQQPFIQACFVSASPNPHFRPRQTVVLNKGCASVSSDSDHVVAEYAAPTREGAINLVLNTSTLTSEVYIHCSVLMSASGITPASKSCNYNKIQSRWEELSGNVEVCSCCSSRCRSLKQLTSATKAIISTGPFHIVEKEMEAAPLQSGAQVGDSSQISGAETMQSDAAAPVMTEYQASSTYSSGPGASSVHEIRVVSEATGSEANEMPETQLAAPLGVAQGMVVLSRGPVARLTMWLPGSLTKTHPLLETEMAPSLSGGVATASEPGDSRLNDIQSDLPATGEDLPVSPGSSENGRKVSSDVLSDADMRTQSMVAPLDGWPIPESLEGKSALREESKRKRWGTRPEMLYDKTQRVYKGSVTENGLNEATRHEENWNPRRNHGDTDMGGVRPVIRSRVQFTKGVDGSRTLSYEEDVIKQQQEDKPKMQSFGKEIVSGNQKGQRALHTFLDLLRYCFFFLIETFI